MREIKLPVTSSALIIGLALIGNGVDGSTGAGIALVGCVSAGFVAALLFAGRGSGSTARRRPRRTIRHWLLVRVDAGRHRRGTGKHEREQRRTAEREYLRRRAARDREGKANR